MSQFQPPPNQQWQQPQPSYQQPYQPQPQVARPVRKSIKYGALVLMITAAAMYLLAGQPALPMAEVLNLAGFILVFFI